MNDDQMPDNRKELKRLRLVSKLFAGLCAVCVILALLSN